MHLSFKEYCDFTEAAALSDEEFIQFLEEGLFSSDDDRVEKYKQLLANKDPMVRRDAERGLALLVKKGNLKAKALSAQHERAKAKQKEAEDAKMRHAQSVNQAADQGSSSAWRSETGNVKREPKGSGGSAVEPDETDFTAKGHFNWKRDTYRR